ncbi:MAG: SRPBCC family protein [Verrucomicrobiaceae bacterium]|nr:SRPBCC family protein [Verrucomicrobiaceae bacterium]
MLKKILIVIAVLILGVIATALLKSPDYRVERSLVIAAPAEKLFPWFDNHKKFNEWNPWMKMDPEAKNTYTGPEAGVGAVASWEGPKTGKGSATITESKPNERIVERMDWLEPMQGVSTVEFTFKPEGEGKTKVTWAMYGTNEGLLAKVMSVVMDCESMCGPEFEKGLADVAKLVTAPN